MIELVLKGQFVDQNGPDEFILGFITSNITEISFTVSRTINTFQIHVAIESLASCSGGHITFLRYVFISWIKSETGRLFLEIRKGEEFLEFYWRKAIFLCLPLISQVLMYSRNNCWSKFQYWKILIEYEPDCFRQFVKMIMENFLRFFYN